MRNKIKNILIIILILIGSLLTTTKVLFLNLFSHSLPYGIYLRINGVPRAGDYASSFLTQEIANYGRNRGYLGKGYSRTGIIPILKIIRGVPGDRYSVQNGFFELGGQRYQMSQKDPSGRPLRPFYHGNFGILGPGEYLLLSNYSPYSWDSRYWGPVTIEFLFKPLFIWELSNPKIKFGRILDTYKYQ